MRVIFDMNKLYNQYLNDEIEQEDWEEKTEEMRDYIVNRLGSSQNIFWKSPYKPYWAEYDPHYEISDLWEIYDFMVDKGTIDLVELDNGHLGIKDEHGRVAELIGADLSDDELSKYAHWDDNIEEFVPVNEQLKEDIDMKITGNEDFEVKDYDLEYTGGGISVAYGVYDNGLGFSLGSDLLFVYDEDSRNEFMTDDEVKWEEEHTVFDEHSMGVSNSAELFKSTLKQVFENELKKSKESPERILDYYDLFRENEELLLGDRIDVDESLTEGAEGKREPDYDSPYYNGDDEEECEWCGENTPTSELHNTNYGKICDYCIQAIKSRGEKVRLRKESMRKGIKEGREYRITESINLTGNEEFIVKEVEVVYTGGGISVAYGIYTNGLGFALSSDFLFVYDEDGRNDLSAEDAYEWENEHNVLGDGSEGFITGSPLFNATLRQVFKKALEKFPNVAPEAVADDADIFYENEDIIKDLLNVARPGKAGDTYTNENGAKIRVISQDGNDVHYRITSDKNDDLRAVRSTNEDRNTTKESFKNIIEKNGYTKDDVSYTGSGKAVDKTKNEKPNLGVKLTRDNKDEVEEGDKLVDSSNEYIVTSIWKGPRSTTITVKDTKDWRPIYSTPISSWYGTILIKGPFTKEDTLTEQKQGVVAYNEKMFDNKTNHGKINTVQIKFEDFGGTTNNIIKIAKQKGYEVKEQDSNSIVFTKKQVVAEKLLKEDTELWSSDQTASYYADRANIEDLRAELDDQGVDHNEWSDEEVRNWFLEDDFLMEADYDSFKFNILPAIDAQCYADVLVLFGDVANWQGTRNAATVLHEAKDFTDYIYPAYDATSTIYKDNTGIYYTQSTHDTPTGGTKMYLYSLKSEEDLDKLTEYFTTPDGWFDPEYDYAVEFLEEHTDYNDIKELINKGILTPIKDIGM